MAAGIVTVDNVSQTVIDLVHRYLNLLHQENFLVSRAVLFGSQARGEGHADSDIDVLIISPAFEPLTWAQEERLWTLTVHLDSRLEPIPCGELHWRTDRVSPLLAAARQEGIVIDLDPNVPPYPARKEFATND